MASVAELGEQLANLTIAQAVELKNLLKDKYGIEPAGGGMMIAPAPAAGGGGGEAAAAAPTEFNVLIEPGFDELNAGDFDGAPIDTYWSWKAGHTSDETFPGGESEDDALRRYADALQRLLRRTEPVTLVVTHEHALRSIATAADYDSISLGPDTAFMNAVPFSFDERALRRARTGLLARERPTVRPQMEPGGMSGLAA